MEKETTNFFLDILSRIKIEGIRFYDIFVLFCLGLVIDLWIRKEKSIFIFIIKMFMEFILTISFAIKGKNKKEELQSKPQTEVIERLLKNHYVFNKLNDLLVELQIKIKSKVSYWIDNKIGIYFPNQDIDFINSILINDQKKFSDVFQDITEKHLENVGTFLQIIKRDLKIQETNSNSEFIDNLPGKMQKELSNEINKYNRIIQEKIINENFIGKNIIFHQILRTQTEIFLQIVLMIKEKIMQNYMHNTLNIDDICRKYFESIYVQIDFLISVISNDIKSKIIQKNEMDQELDKLIQILRNEKIEIVTSYEEMLKLTNIEKYQITIIDLNDSTKYINKSFINTTGENNSMNDWMDLKSFLERINLDFIYDKYNIDKGEG